MQTFGLIGYPLGHSFSKGYFTGKFKKENIANSEYVNFPIESIDKFPDVIKNNPDIKGLNVTIPYKEQVMQYLHEIDETAKAVGAVNTIKFSRQGNDVKLKGFNTDIYGFEQSLLPLLESYHKKALILGTGGASKAIKYVLKKLQIEFVSASIEELKENEITYEEITRETMAERLVIINATPLGTYPKIDTCPSIPYDFITNKHVMFDLVYNPEVTLFLQHGKDKGTKTQNGLKMLHLQAEKAWEIWNI